MRCHNQLTICFGIDLPYQLWKNMRLNSIFHFIKKNE